MKIVFTHAIVKIKLFLTGVAQVWHSCCKIAWISEKITLSKINRVVVLNNAWSFVFKYFFPFSNLLFFPCTKNWYYVILLSPKTFSKSLCILKLDHSFKKENIFYFLTSCGDLKITCSTFYYTWIINLELT